MNESVDDYFKKLAEAILNTECDAPRKIIAVLAKDTEKLNMFKLLCLKCSRGILTEDLMLDPIQIAHQFQQEYRRHRAHKGKQKINLGKVDVMFDKLKMIKSLITKIENLVRSKIQSQESLTCGEEFKQLMQALHKSYGDQQEMQSIFYQIANKVDKHKLNFEIPCKNLVSKNTNKDLDHVISNVEALLKPFWNLANDRNCELKQVQLEDVLQIESNQQRQKVRNHKNSLQKRLLTEKNKHENLVDEMQTKQEEDLDEIYRLNSEIQKKDTELKKLTQDLNKYRIVAQTLSQVKNKIQKKDTELKLLTQDLNKHRKLVQQLSQDNKYYKEEFNRLNNVQKMINICIRDSNYRQIFISVLPSYKIEVVQTLIKQKNGIPIEKQSLIYQGYVLDDVHMLSDYGVQQGRESLELQIVETLEQPKITVQVFPGTSFLLDVNLKDPVDSIKSQLQELQGFNYDVQTINFNGRDITKYQFLYQAGIKNQSELQMVRDEFITVGINLQNHKNKKLIFQQFQPSITIQTIKLLIQAQYGMPVINQVIYSEGKILEDDKSLQYYQIQNDSRIELEDQKCNIF